MGLMVRYLLCAGLVSLCFAARADFSISTLGSGPNPVYDDGLTPGTADDSVLVSVAFGGPPTFPLTGIAVGFMFDIPVIVGATQAYASFATVPLFETRIGADVFSARLYILEDTVPGDNLFAAPNLSAVVATFDMPSPDWPNPVITVPTGSAASLTTVGASASSALTDDGDGTPYWLVMEISGGSVAFNSVVDTWYRSLTASDPFRTGDLLLGIPTPGTETSPAYRLDFIPIDPVPEPSTAIFLSLGCVGGLLLRRRRAA